MQQDIVRTVYRFYWGFFFPCIYLILLFEQKSHYYLSETVFSAIIENIVSTYPSYSALSPRNTAFYYIILEKEIVSPLVNSLEVL